MGNLTIVWVGWGKLKQKCNGFNSFLVLKSLTAIKTCLDDVEEFEGRDTAIS